MKVRLLRKFRKRARNRYVIKQVGKGNRYIVYDADMGYKLYPSISNTTTLNMAKEDCDTRRRDYIKELTRLKKVRRRIDY